MYASSISECTSFSCYLDACRYKASLYCVSSLQSFGILPLAQLQRKPHSSVMENAGHGQYDVQRETMNTGVIP